MPKTRAFLAAVVIALATQVPAPAAPPLPVQLGTRPCTPVSPLDSVRPASCQRTTYVYGPLHITPGDNLILVGPVTIERPREAGYVVRFRPDLVRIDGSVPPIDEVHLHHSVWISTAFGHPMFASGEEKTIFSIPNGYGIPFNPSRELWLLNYMIHNLLATPDNVFITYEVDFIPERSVAPGSIRPVEPFWLDVAGYNGANPIYNTQRGFGAVPGECSFPREECAGFDPYGKTDIAGQGIAGNGFGYSATPPAGTIVWMVGHVHPGGLRTDVDIVRAGTGTKRVFTSDAVYWDPNGPVSWDMAMETTRPDYRLRISPGDRLVLNSVYETSRASWYEGMGIVVLFIARGDDSGPDPFATQVNPDNTAITHGHLPEADRHGGPDQPAPPTASRVAWSDVGIIGFNYLPGQGGSIPAVKRGQPIRFYNFDAAAQVFHTITSCAWPCNGPTGISYPLADGSIDFDSLELGYGIRGLTAAANRADFTIDTTPYPPGEYTYFCRIHPSMRGAFAVE
jgi:plastocyanin